MLSLFSAQNVQDLSLTKGLQLAQRLAAYEVEKCKEFINYSVDRAAR